jgi:hypothetical protein
LEEAFGGAELWEKVGRVAVMEEERKREVDQRLKVGKEEMGRKGV